MPRRAIALIVLAFACSAAARAAGPVLVPSGDLPPSVTALGPLDQASGFDLSADRAVAVAVLPSSRNPGRSVLRVARGDAPKEVELQGTARAVALTDDGQTAYAIAVESDKKGIVRRTTLVRVDLAAPKIAMTITLPASAGGLAPAAGGRALLVASHDELRTFVLPALTSGPLYRVLGDNVAVAPLAGTTRVLVAQGASLFLVDLAGPQDRDGLKIADRVDTGASVRQLVASPDEAVALALTDTGQALDVRLDPLQVVPRGAAIVAAWPGTPAETPPSSPSPAPVAAAVAPPPASPEPAAAPPTPEPAAAATGAVAGTAAATAAAEAVPKEKPPEPPSPVEPPPPVPVPPSAPAPSGPGTISGTLTGPDRSEVEAVVALGPDNVLKQAARVAPEASGRFVFEGLAPGAYRIVATGKNGRVLVCDPPFATIRLGPGGSAEAPALSVQKGY